MQGDFSKGSICWWRSHAWKFPTTELSFDDGYFIGTWKLRVCRCKGAWEDLDKF